MAVFSPQKEKKKGKKKKTQMKLICKEETIRRQYDLIDDSNQATCTNKQS